MAQEGFSIILVEIKLYKHFVGIRLERGVFKGPCFALCRGGVAVRFSRKFGLDEGYGNRPLMQAALEIEARPLAVRSYSGCWFYGLCASGTGQQDFCGLHAGWSQTLSVARYLPGEVGTH